jgi:hypothetical protein
MCRSRLSAIGERTLFIAQANSTDCGSRARGGPAIALNPSNEEQ